MLIKNLILIDELRQNVWARRRMHLPAVKGQTSLCICTVLPEPSLLTHKVGTFMKPQPKNLALKLCIQKHKPWLMARTFLVFISRNSAIGNWAWYNPFSSASLWHKPWKWYNSRKYSDYHMSHRMRFLTIWNFDKCRLRWACTASF